VGERPITDWLHDGDDERGVGGPQGQGDTDPSEEDPWRPRPEATGSRRLWRLTALSWVGLGVLLVVLTAAGRVVADPVDDGPSPAEELAAGLPAEGEDAAVEASPAAPPTGAPAAPAASAEPPAASASAAGEPAGGRDAEHAVTAAAAVAVRLHVTAGVDPARYVDLVAPVSVERHADLAVVTLAVVLLEGREGRWESVRPARYAVAVDTAGGGPRVVGGPWPLPDPAADAGAVAPDEEEVEPLPPSADAEAVLLALGDAGYGGAALSGALAGAPPGLLRVRVHAVAPGEAHAEVHDVWLENGERPRVLGLAGGDA
jgi:hypothetical protein